MSPGTKKLVISAVLLLCATPAGAQDMMAQPKVIDARRALPMVPALSWKDGFFLEHAGVPDLGLHPRVTMLYTRNPIGADAGLSDRVILQPSMVLSILKWVDIGLALPVTLWQDDSGFNVSRTALGDLRLQPKLRILPESFPIGAAVSLGLGFPTGNAGARLSAAQVSFFPRAIVEWLTIKKRLLIVANIGGFLAGSGGSCNPNEQPLDPSDPMKMKRLPCPMACDPEQQPLDPSDPMKMKRLPCPMMSNEQLMTLSQVVQGLGNHFFYGVGFTAMLSPDLGLQLHTELIGSFSFTSQAGKTPLFWNVGVMRSASNKWNFGAMYGIGLTDGSPGHTVMAQLSYAWEHKEEKEKGPPKMVHEFQPIPPININLTGVGGPAGAPQQGAPQQGAPQQGAPQQGAPQQGAPQQGAPQQGGGPVQGAPQQGVPQQQPSGAGQGAAPGQPASQRIQIVIPPASNKPKSVEVEVPDDWWPKEEKKDDKKK